MTAIGKGDVIVSARRVWLRLQTVFRRSCYDRRLNDEVQFHLEQHVAENLAEGMSAHEAGYAAMRIFGNPTFLKEETRNTSGWERLEQIACDFAMPRACYVSPPALPLSQFSRLPRHRRQHPIFTLIDAILLRPLPVRDSDRVVLLKWEARKQPLADGYSSYGFCYTGEQSAEPDGCSFSRP